MLKTLDDFDFGARNPINESLIRQLTAGEDLDARENVLMIGNSGPGKTHLVTSLGFAACAQGKGVRFRSASALVTHMLEMREQRELKPFFAQVEKHDLIILDELGYVPFPKAGAEPLFEIVSRGYGRLSLIVTTNLPFERWTEVHGKRAAHRGAARPPDSPGAYHRGQRRELPPQRRPETREKAEGGMIASRRGRLVAPRAPRRPRCEKPPRTPLLTQPLT